MSGRRDLDPAPENWVLDSFDQLGRFRYDPVADSLLPAPEPPAPRRHQVERIQRELVVERRLGLRSWTERSVITIYRTVKP